MPSDRVRVPLRRLTEETAAGLGTIIRSIDEAAIELVRWPTGSGRPVTSGGYGDVVEGPFEIFWEGNAMYSRNLAVDRSDQLGTRAPEDPALLLVDEVNYHADGGQAFIAPGVPTVFLVAPPGDDVAPEDFVALYSDGSVGLNMHTGVWHTAPLPLAGSAVFDNKQGSVHATVAIWAQREFGALLAVPLRAPEDL